MKRLLLLFSIYTYLPCYGMEQVSLFINNETPLRRSNSQLSLLGARENTKLVRKKIPCKTACLKVAPLWAVALPIALGSIPVGLYGVAKQLPALKYVSYCMDAASVLIAAGWFIKNYKKLEQERQEFIAYQESKKLSEQLTQLNAFDETLEENE